MLSSGFRLFGRAPMIAAVFLVASTAFAYGPRLVVHVNESFEANGRVFPAGTLTLRTVAQLNPSATLNEIWIGDECLGVLIAERSLSGRGAARDAAVFERNPEGRLVLVGYVLRTADSDSVFRYRSLVPSVARSRGPLAPEEGNLLSTP